MLAQQVTIVVLESELPEQRFFHGQLWCGFPVEWQIVRGNHLSPLILPKLHFVKGTDPNYPTDWHPWWPSLQHPDIYKSRHLLFQQMQRIRFC